MCDCFFYEIFIANVALVEEMSLFSERNYIIVVVQSRIYFHLRVVSVFSMIRIVSHVCDRKRKSEWIDREIASV